MEKTKPVELLKRFSPHELKAFDQFIRSPYFNTNEKLTRFYSALQKQHPFTDAEKIDRRKLYKQLYPGEAFNDQRIRDLSSGLLALLERFLAAEALKKKPVTEMLLVLQELETRQLDPLFEARMKEAQRLAEKQTDSLYSLQLNRFLLADLRIDHLHRRYTGRLDKISEQLDYVGLVNAHLEFALTRIISNISFEYNYHLIYNFPFTLEKYLAPLHTLYEALGIRSVHTEMTLIDMLLLVTQEHKHYFRLKELLFSDESSDIPAMERKNFITNLINFSYRETRKGNEAFIPEVRDLNDRALLQKEVFLLEHGKLPHIFFTNHTLMLLRTGELKTAESFVEEYAAILPDELREDTVRFARAHIAYARKEYAAALQQLGLIKPLTNPRKIDIKSLTMMIFYDKKDFAQVKFVIDALVHQIKSDSYNPVYREAALRFVRLFRELMKLRQERNKKGAVALLAKINSGGELAHRSWLREKATVLAKTTG